jgi:hypothetical protein
VGEHAEGSTMRLPEVAARLRELAIDLGCNELGDLADEIARRPVGGADEFHPDD